MKLPPICDPQIAEWMIEHGFKWNYENERHLFIDNLPLLKRKIEEGGRSWHFMAIAARNGSKEMMKWGEERGKLWNSDSLAEAIQYLNAHIDANYGDLIDWMIDLGCPLYDSACSSCGRLEILIHLRNKGCPWDSRTLCNAVNLRDNSMFFWAFGNDCPLSAHVIDRAIYWSNVEVLSCLIEKGYPITRQQISHGSISIVKWFMERGYSPDWAVFCEEISITDEKVIWASKHNGGQWGNTFSNAVHSSNVEILPLLKELGCPAQVKCDVKLFPSLDYQHFEPDGYTVKWLRENNIEECQSTKEKSYHFCSLRKTE
eukprot:TRINITY_DN12632_c0_g1_i1.p1 TRINITY_DN12632_c0_g1~~TRINITY_DN12632_c0_g1_i1.p1  ORF type:complete len:315 (-),score=30.38 TRINITY_DN12632_c0_g1_i1:57-1001(-)